MKVVGLIASREPGLDLGLGARVHRRGRVVQNQDARLGEQGPSDRHPLTLPTRQGQAALADHGLVAVEIAR